MRPRQFHLQISATGRRDARGFTLVELMISIVLMLLLSIAIQQVFKIASTSVGAGQAMGQISRDNRAVQTVLNNDFAQSVIRSNDCPAFIIRSSRVAAFLDAADAGGDIDYATLYATNPDPTEGQVEATIRTYDFDGNNSEADPTDVIPRNRLGQRNFRQDMVSFFARHQFPRQTANEGQYVSNLTSSEAWIWYGHLRQPADAKNTATVNKEPGIHAFSSAAGNPKTENAKSNPNNFYARQWGLGRVAILLREPQPASTGNRFILPNGVAMPPAGDPPVNVRQYFHFNSSPAIAHSTKPLGQDAQATNGTTADTTTLIQHSRYDLAGTSIDGFREQLKRVIAIPLAQHPPDWFGANWMSMRFAGFPRPLQPLTSYGVARTTPWLVAGCTSFVVEFAGDFLNQNADGTIIDNYRNDDGDPNTPSTDGFVDFKVLNGMRHTRWYGFPRDVGGPITPANPTGLIPDGLISNGVGSPDVLPLRDSLQGIPAPCEHFLTNGSQSPFPVANYNNPAIGQEYIVAWQPPGTYKDPATDAPVADPPKPMMVRITMTIDDPDSRLPEGQTYEYVIELP
jgi:prepilin-type N-terminal cleavage/methylation domain-containing protein